MRRPHIPTPPKASISFWKSQTGKDLTARITVRVNGNSETIKVPLVKDK